MKKTHKILLALGSVGLAAVTPAAFAQDASAVTIPVGYATTTASTEFTFMSANLHNAIAWQGVLDNTGSAGADVFTAGEYNAGNDSGDANAPIRTKYFIEIAEGANEGARIDIQSNTANTITPVAEGGAAFLALLDGNTSTIIRKHLTLQDVFGGDGSAAPPNLQIDAGGDSAAADNVLLFSNADGFQTFFYSNFFLSPGWRDGAGNLSADVQLDPGSGLVFKDSNGDNDEIVVVGHVKATKTLVPLDVGFNLVGPPVPVDRNLSDLFGGDGTPAGGNLQLQGGGDVNSADNVLTFDGSTFDTFFYSNFIVGSGWNPSDNQVDFNDSVFVKIQSEAKTWEVDLFD